MDWSFGDDVTIAGVFFTGILNEGIVIFPKPPRMLTAMLLTTCVALAETFGKNNTLQPFTPYSRHLRLDTEACVALAQTLGKKSTMRSFTLDASPSQRGDKAGVVLAEAVGASSSTTPPEAYTRC